MLLLFLFLPLLFGLPPLLPPEARPGWNVAKVGDEREPHSAAGAVAGSAAMAGGETETVVALSDARKASIGGILT